MMTIPIGVTARNEAKNILALLESLRAAIARASSDLGCRYEIHVLLNDNDDNTPDLLRGAGIRIWNTYGGIVEAQRKLAESFGSEAPFLVFSDADILIEPDALLEVSRAMLCSPEVEVAYAEKYPIPPLRRTPLARALYFYNLREGYQTTRHYFNGQFFAIRRWNIPRRESLAWDRALDNRFLNLEAGIRLDDIYLSRDLLNRVGPEGIRCVAAGIRYHAPQTLWGMFRRYQRMKLEIERLNCYFPATGSTHRKFGRRRLDTGQLRRAPVSEKLYYGLFRLALILCQIAYFAQKTWYTHVARTPCPTWSPVKETGERVP